MTTIELDSHRWTVGSALPDGVGGFGQVFDAEDELGRAGVAKFVAKARGAERELLMGDSLAAAQARNVIPVWDSGEDGDQWVIVMPKAETSLAAHMTTAGVISLAEAVDILADIAIALAELAAMNPAIVHRDLKPANVLRHGGAWCLADFGIAKYAEQTTGPDTLKWNLSRPYASPEQWRLESATPATDVYAFGVIAYELLAGEWPFPGPDFRAQHLTQVAPTLSGGTPRLRTLVEECLWKPPTSRPSAANLFARLAMVAEAPTSPGASRLAEANSIESKRLSRDYAEALIEAERENDDAAMFEVAKQSFDSIWTPLLASIEADAPLATVDQSSSAGRGSLEFLAQLRNGKLGVSRPVQNPGWDGPFRVIASAVVSVNQPRNSGGYEGRAHSLWFCDAQEAGRFAWYETAFMHGGFSSSVRSVVPYSCSPREASVALSNVIGTEQLAWPFEELDRADASEFVDRWLGWFADASADSLHYPSTMPEKNTSGSHRRG